MNFAKLKLFFLAILVAFQINFAQSKDDYAPQDNWLKDYGIYSEQYLYFRFDRYSKEDLIELRKRLDALKTARYENKWHGVFAQGGEETVGFSQLRLHPEIGFVNISIYTCTPELRSLNFGRIVETPDYITLIYENSRFSLDKEVSTKYIKIKWNQHYFLVQEESLKAFAEKAVGIWVEPEEVDFNSHWTNYWVNGDDDEFTGLPEFPPNYQSFRSLPIQTKILAVSKPVFKNSITLGPNYYGGNINFYSVRIGAGQLQGVKKGLKLFVEEISEEITIQKVFKNYSTGVIVRSLDENKSEICNEDSETGKCPSINPNTKASSRIGYFWY